MIKRRQGSSVRGHNYWSQCRDLRLMALVHNVMILMLVNVFCRARKNPFQMPLTVWLAFAFPKR